MIVLFLFVFCAEESLTQETVDQSKTIRKAMRVIVDHSVHFRKSSVPFFVKRLPRALLPTSSCFLHTTSMANTGQCSEIEILFSRWSSTGWLRSARFPLMRSIPSLWWTLVTTEVLRWTHWRKAGSRPARYSCKSHRVLSALSLRIVLFFPLWSKLVVYRGQLILCLLCMAGLMLLEPLVSVFNASPPVCQFAITYFGYAISVPVRALIYKWLFFSWFTFSVCIVLIANSTYKEFRGAAIGLGQLVASIARFIVGKGGDELRCRDRRCFRRSIRGAHRWTNFPCFTGFPIL